MILHKALQLINDVDRLYVSSIEDSVDALIQQLKDYLQNRGLETDYSHQRQC